MEKTIAEGLEQNFEYMDRVWCDNGNLLIFDKSENKSWDEKIFREERKYNSKKIVIWGM